MPESGISGVRLMREDMSNEKIVDVQRACKYSMHGKVSADGRKQKTKNAMAQLIAHRASLDCQAGRTRTPSGRPPLTLVTQDRHLHPCTSRAEGRHPSG